MSEYNYRPELAGDSDLQAAVRHMLTREGYEFNAHASLGDYLIDFVAWKPDAPDHVTKRVTTSLTLVRNSLGSP